MRITNQMMTSSMLSHVNQNKLTMSQLESQYSTGKKIQRPSENPIIAVRALKLRSSLTEINQYLETNIPDALSWMTVTESAMDNMNEFLIQMAKFCDQGAHDTLTATQRNNILQNLQNYAEQIREEGNTQYAGRYVFTGYKTDTPLLFGEDTKYSNTATGAFGGYTINESFTGNDIKQYSNVNIPEDETKQAEIVTSKRLQLSYNKLYAKETGAGGATTYSDTVNSITYKIGGTETNVNVTKTLLSTDAGAYKPGANEVYVLADTGEIIFGETIAANIEKADSIAVQYNKQSFVKGDILPEHYFSCTKTEADGTKTVYEKKNESIAYEVNFGHKLKVNTEARDAFSHDIGRMIDDISTAVNKVMSIEDEMARIKERQKDATLSKTDLEKLEAKYSQLETAKTLATSVMQESFSKAITLTQKFQDQVNVASADLGARYNRLLLTQSRLEDQQVEVEDLKSSNEDVDLVETIIRYKAAESVYRGSLSAISNVVKTTLLDFL